MTSTLAITNGLEDAGISEEHLQTVAVALLDARPNESPTPRLSVGARVVETAKVLLLVLVGKFVVVLGLVYLITTLVRPR